LEDTLDYYLDHLESYTVDMQTYAEGWQKSFGQAGDPGAADLMQAAKVFAGKIKEMDEAYEGPLEDALAELEDEAEAMATDDGVDFATYENAQKADKLVADMKGLWPKVKAATKEAKAMKELASPVFSNATSWTQALSQYYPVMYFVDKAFVDAPSTCTGKAVNKPMVYLSASECAMACDAAVTPPACTAFSHFATTGGLNGLCFLFSELKSVTYYTGCKKEAPTFFLQRRGDKKGGRAKEKGVACRAKLSKYDGTSIKPDPSGKCGGCLKKATKAERCFEWPEGAEPTIDSEIEGCHGEPHEC